MDFIEIFTMLCNEKGKSPNSVCEELGFSNATYTYWKKNAATPRDSTLIKIAGYFNVTLSYLTGVTEYRTLEEEADAFDFKANLALEYVQEWLEDNGFEIILNDDGQWYLSNGRNYHYFDDFTFQSLCVNLCDKSKNALDLVMREWVSMSFGDAVNDSTKEQMHINKYRKVDDHGRRVIDMATEYEYKRCFPEHQIGEKSIDFPISFESAAAGWGNYLTDSGFDYIQVNPATLHPKAKFGVRISGDSMEPDYHDGDIIQVEPTPAIVSGELGIFNYEGDGIFKKLIVDTVNGIIILRSLNPKYNDRILNQGENLHTYGRVVGKLEE